eukprot:4788119-Prymnesium_polylepis.1
MLRMPDAKCHRRWCPAGMVPPPTPCTNAPCAGGDGEAGGRTRHARWLRYCPPWGVTTSCVPRVLRETAFNKVKLS